MKKRYAALKKRKNERYSRGRCLVNTLRISFPNALISSNDGMLMNIIEKVLSLATRLSCVRATIFRSRGNTGSMRYFAASITERPENAAQRRKYALSGKKLVQNVPGIAPAAVPTSVKAEYLANVIDSVFFGDDSISSRLTAGPAAVDITA